MINAPNKKEGGKEFILMKDYKPFPAQTLELKKGERLQELNTNKYQPLSETGPVGYGALDADLIETLEKQDIIRVNAPGWLTAVHVYYNGTASGTITMQDESTVEITITAEKLKGLTMDARYLAVAVRAEKYIQCAVNF